MKLSRPKSVIWFERLFVASVFLSAVRASFNWIQKFSNGDFETGGSNSLTVMLLLTTLISFGIEIGLWYFIARRASNIAKWILIAKTTLGLAVMSWTLPSLLRNDLAIIIASTLFIQLLIILSIVFLFRRDARGWFHDKGIIQEDAAGLAEKFR